MTAPKRRWPRFSLRTMFVVVTVLCIWRGYQLNWIRERHALLSDFSGGYPHVNIFHQEDPDNEIEAPGILRLFGEHGVWLIAVTKARRLFPEAKVTWH